MTVRSGARAAAHAQAKSGELDFGADSDGRDGDVEAAGSAVPVAHDRAVEEQAVRRLAAREGAAWNVTARDSAAHGVAVHDEEAYEVTARIDRIDWPRVHRDLDAQGNAVIPSLLTPAECAAVAATYDDDTHFRSRVVMARHGFGRGEYKYFRYPLPPLVAQLRGALYPRLVPVANRWHELLDEPARFPPTHAAYLRRCHAAGQRRPTPLVLRYAAGDYNCLHQDLYGEHVFPLQVAVLLAEPGGDFDGGEFVLTEQRPRMQSRVQVVSLRHGDAVVFAVHHRPVQGTRGFYRVNLRHGVSEIRRGARHTLGVIFHDAT